MITVIGTGRIDGDITLRGKCAIDSADRVIFKTSFSPAYKLFEDDSRVSSLDDIYEAASDFDALNLALAEELVKVKEFNVVYCVDGSGSDDQSVIALRGLCDIEIIAGVAYEAHALANSPAMEYHAIFATDLIARREFMPDTAAALVVKELDNIFLAGDVKLKLLKLLGEPEIIFISGGEVRRIKLDELDRQSEYDNTTMCIIPALGHYKKTRYGFTDLMEITYRLRDPDGCKWDKAQNHQTIRANVIEEAYELVEAVDLGDMDKMCEETGDVLLQGVFHSVIGEDSGEYDIYDVLTVLCNKLITRHTHIFGNVRADNKEDALRAWENAKAVEKGQQSYSDKLDGIAANLPALMRAFKVQKSAKKSGFDWDDISGAVDKVKEELEELLTAEPQHREEEGGDLIFAAVNVLRFMDINPEVALGVTIAKFIRRFKYMERAILASGRKLEECSLQDMDYYWEESKHEDR